MFSILSGERVSSFHQKKIFPTAQWFITWNTHLSISTGSSFDVLTSALSWFQGMDFVELIADSIVREMLIWFLHFSSEKSSQKFWDQLSGMVITCGNVIYSKTTGTASHSKMILENTVIHLVLHLYVLHSSTWDFINSLNLRKSEISYANQTGTWELNIISLSLCFTLKKK